MERKQLLHWIWLSLAMGVANRASVSVLAAFGDASSVYAADEARLSRIEGLSKRTRRALLNKSLERALDVFDLCERKGISIITYAEESFPDVLRTVPLPPVLLYYRGTLPDLNRRLCVAMVGTRSMSEYGMSSAYKISYELAAANCVIVSGMALGIDGVCAAAALAAGGETVAILGCGVDVLYPKQHRVLCEEICRSGAVMSEYPPQTLPLKHHFPERNRLICGMCRATLAIEGGKESGTLITARDALAQKRSVYALPGNIDRESSEGMNLLLDEGAKPLLCASDVLAEFMHTYRSISLSAPSTLSHEVTAPDSAHLTRLGVLRKPTLRRASAEAPKQRDTATDAAPVTRPEAVTLSEELLASLGAAEAAILRCIAERQGAACADDVYALPFSYAELSAAMTQLEIKRLIRRLPGSLIGLNGSD